MIQISGALSDILYLVHNGSVPLVTAIECIFTDCTSSLIFADYLFFPALTPPEQNVLKPFTQVSLYFLLIGDCNTIWVILRNTEGFSQTFIPPESLFSLSHFLYNVKTWENI